MKKMKRTLFLAVLGVGFLLASGCGDSDTETYDVETTVLGLSKSADFEQSGRLGISLLPTDADSGEGIAKVGLDYDIDVVAPDGVSVTLEKIETSRGGDRGQFAVLMDSSGSISGDKAERDQAAKVIIENLFKYASDSKIGLFDWSGSNHPGNLSTANAVHDFAGTKEEQALLDAADMIGASGGTPLYDSMYELLVYTDAEKSKDAAPALIALTDGKDTRSGNSLDDVIAKAQELNIRVHNIGIGAAAAGSPSADPSAIEDARRLAEETGGIYKSVENLSELDVFAQNIARGVADGFDKTTVTLDPIPSAGTTIEGTVKATGKHVKSSNTANWTLSGN